MKKFVFLSIVGLLFSCQSKTKQVDDDLKLMAYSVPITIRCDLNTTDSLVVLPNDITNQIFKYIKSYDGFKPEISTSIPSEWEINYALESPSSDFSIWIISNSEGITHKMLLIIKETEGKKEVTDGLLIAYNVANEKEGFIESEEWKTTISEEYILTVEKRYEKLYSLTGDVIHSENELKEITDVYYITNFGKIKYEQPEIFETEYMAVIQFADTSDYSIVLDDAWLWNSIEMQEMLEPKGIFFEEATSQFNCIPIKDYHGAVVDKVNISSFLSTHSKGYILLKNNQKPQFIRFCSAKECVKKVFPYFGFEYEEEEEIFEEEDAI